MRVMVFAKMDENDPALAAAMTDPTAEMLEAFAAMDRFNDELVAAGVLVAAAGLHPTVRGKRIVSKGKGLGRAVIDGPFTETREVVAGFSIWEVKDMDEALDWALRSPDGMPGSIEIRPFMEVEDLAAFVTPEELAAGPRDGERGRLGVA